MNAMKRIIAVLLCLLLSVGMLSVVASADSVFGTATQGTLTIYKYKEGTGATVDATGKTQTVTGHTPLSGVTFTVYEVLDEEGLKAYLAGGETLQASNYYTTNDTKPKYTTNLAASAKVAEETTGNDGKVTFTLPLGLYLVVESDYPAEVTSPMVPFLVSIPTTDPVTEDNWLYDVTVYPKNSTSTGDVTLVKKSDTGTYLNAAFDLYKKDGQTWTQVGDSAISVPADANGAKITGLTHGEYKLVEKSTAEGYIVDRTPITFSVDQNNGNKVTYTSTTRPNATASTASATENLTITVTNEKPTVAKELTSDNATPGVGGTVSFEVTVDVPTNIADMAAYVVKDEPVNLGVKLDTVKIGGNAVDTSLYTLEQNGNGFTLTFKVADNTANFRAIAGQSIVITYDALVLPGAATAGKTENTVTLTYNDGVSGNAVAADTVSDMAYYNIDITKRLDSNTGMLAAGIEFLLTKKNASGTYEPVTATLSEGEYTYSGTAATGTTLVTTATGKLVVNGLPEGEYKLKETKAKDGYNLLDKEIEITLNASNAKFQQTVVNKAGFTLPQTGGLGTLLFILIGGVLMAGGILLVMPKKKRAN